MFAMGVASTPSYALTVTSARLGVHPDKNRLVLELSGKTDFRVFVLGGPNRVIIDMPHFTWQPGRPSMPPGTEVTDIRQGDLQSNQSGGNLSRIVMDVRRPVAIKSAFLIPPSKGNPERLVIDFAAVGSAAFEAAKNEVHGTLGGAPAPDMQAAKIPRQAVAYSRQLAPPQQDNKPYGSMVLPEHKPERTAGRSIGSDRNDSPYADMAPPSLAPGQKPLIIIDAGHGGVDPGAIGAGGVFEKNVTLAMAKELKRQLEATGIYKVRLTRDNDIYLKLYQRVDIARGQKADLFISLHADSMGNSATRGASVYTLSEKASDEQTEMLADRENRADLIAGVDLSGEDKQVAGILVDLAMRDTMNQSSFFANTLVGDLSQNGVTILEKPHRHAGFAVLKAPDIPSVLIEMGFLSNRTEAARLSDSSYRTRFARALTVGIGAYFEKVRRNQRM